MSPLHPPTHTSTFGYALPDMSMHTLINTTYAYTQEKRKVLSQALTTECPLTGLPLRTHLEDVG